MTTGGKSRSGDERPADEGSAAKGPEDDEARAAKRAPDGGQPGDTAAALLESAAEIVVGAAIAPFTGGETMPIVATVAEALEGGVDRLTHLGHPHQAAPENAEEAEPPKRDKPPA